MALNQIPIEEQSKLPLKDFIDLPTTVDFLVMKNKKLLDYIKNRPYIKLGNELITGYVIGYTNEAYIDEIYSYFGSDFVHFYPNILVPLDSQSNSEAGITQIQKLPYLDLKGQGVIIGFVDTGIDYTKDVFKFSDGTTKIKYIWDQSIPGNPPENYFYGSIYNQEQINKAIKSPKPLEIVPSVDTVGHGTFLASVATGNAENEYIGAAPLSDIICVKLRNFNKALLKNITSIKNDNDPFLEKINAQDIFSSNDLILGIDFILSKANELRKPVVICVGLGSNAGYHDGKTPMEEYISAQCENKGVVFITAGGNQSNANQHTQGKLLKTGDEKVIRVSSLGVTNAIQCNIWSAGYDKISVSVKSPGGEVLERAPVKYGTTRNKLIFENTVISISYFKGEQNAITVIITTSTPGIWEITLYGDKIVVGDYDSWLGIFNKNIQFLEPIPNKTIVTPATAIRSITTGAYDGKDGRLYTPSSWGPTNAPRPAPDFVAPGVDVKGVYPSGFGTMSGTSVSAAITSGAAALLLQWAIVEKNDITMDCDKVRTLLISGCTRDEETNYPNDQFGFGKLNLFQTFKFLRE